ncbi:unnamed protein product [Gongylonema pulchrum]|uniref:Mitochondrial inner membrane protein OXA1 n=1 Tax=Gongylonema pulchrum TaxID=637853 RepID=A0A183E517_9BILA|nr:unnamed protein product [Gongylonema pulchrum]
MKIFFKENLRKCLPYQNVTSGIPLSRISAANATESVSAATVAIQKYELPEKRLLVAKIRNPTSAAVLEALRNLSDDVETKDDFIPLSLSAINSGASFSAAVSSTPLFTASAGIGGILSTDTILNEMQAAAAQISERVAEIRSRKQELVQYTISHSGAVTNDQKEDILSQKKQIISDLEECERMCHHNLDTQYISTRIAGHRSFCRGHVLENSVVTAAQPHSEQKGEQQKHDSDTGNSENDSAQADDDDKSIEDRTFEDLELVVLKRKIYREGGSDTSSRFNCEIV